MSNKILGAIPVLPVGSAERTVEFLCEKLGFTCEWVTRAHENQPDPAYMGFQWDDAFLHASSFPGDGNGKTVVVLAVADIDALFEQLRERGVPIALSPTDQTWGQREMYIDDPDGNSIRFVQAR